MRLLCLGALLGACAAPTPVAQSAPALSASAAGLPLSDLARADVRGAREAALAYRERVRVSPVRTEPAARRIAVTCPYRRASFQLAFALQQETAQIPEAEVEPIIQWDWHSLQHGLAAHVETLEAMGVELVLPLEGDYLHDKLPPAAALDRASLAAAESPVAATLPLLGAIDGIVQGYDATVSATITEDQDTLAQALGSDALLSQQMEAWRTALVRLRPFVEEPARAERIDRMIEALTMLQSTRC